MDASNRLEPPSGTVTFLFTDIEASTRLMAALGDAYGMLLDQHDDLLREVWARHGGYEINTGGDAFYVAFSSAADAVCAAADGQRAIEAARWAGEARPRVRMGLHTGFARPRRGDYAALAVNQTARIVGAAHGGQTLVSADTVAVLDAEPRTSLQPLGRFRIRDFDTPQHLYAVVAEGWTDPGRPPRLQPADGHNLVRPLTRLIDREQDRAWLEANLRPGALTTLLGPGGVGKTRLAIEVGLAVAERWPDGVWFVDLAPVRAGDRLANEIAAAVGAPQTPGLPPFEDVRAHLEDREALLILDNCEHLADAVARTVHDVLVACPRVGVLATSRAPLGLRAETAHRLQPLPTGSDDSPAVTLFLDRATGFHPDEVTAVRELCRQLDGLPLALELAAARTTAMTPSMILEGLHRSPAELRSGDPTLPERHRSLEQVLDWSWELLDEPARAVLRRLALFAGSFDLRLAAVACADGTLRDEDVPRLLWTLLDHSLVLTDRIAGETRFRLPVSVRVYAGGHTGHEEAASTALRLARHYLDVLGPERATGHAWRGRMATELDNVRGVIRDLAGLDEAAAQALAWSVGHHHDLNDAYATGVDETAEHLGLLPSRQPSRVALLTLLADLHLRRGHVDAADAALTEASELRAAVGAPPWDGAGLRKSQGDLALHRGEFVRAAALAEEALAEASSPRDRARAWNLLGLAKAVGGDLTAAAVAFEAELRATTEGGLETLLPTAHGNLAEVHLQLGDRAAAARHQRACLDLARANRETVSTAFSVMVAARLLATDGDLTGAATLHHAALEALETAGRVLYESDAEVSAALLEETRAQLGRTAFEQAEAEGRALTLERAAELAEDVLDGAMHPGRDGHGGA